ncbi:ABC transporter substrate-binding protein [Agromyces aureus]|uniref:ABC transporter substrate-binding protein n=1 Tax=Agromyces aureus TaxID=453304 RepID=UPI00082BE585|nr:ABC transporter substrate-binding protein [Agromyces aureus]
MNTKHSRRTAAAIAVAASGLLLVTACSSGDTAPAASSNPDVLVIDQSFTAQSIDPATIFQVTDAIVATGIYQTLVSYQGDDPTPQPLLASAYAVSDDGRSVTFTLDESATFANGEPVTGDDVVFSLKRLRNLKSSPSYLMDGLTVTAPDEHTVVVASENPASYIPSLLTSTATSIVEADAVRAAGGSDGDDAAETDGAAALFTSAENGVGSGPYQLESYDTNSQITLVSNPEWWGGDPAYERIVIRNVKNPQQQKSSVESGESQIALDIPGRVAEGISTDALEVNAYPSPEVLYLAMTMDPSSPTADPAVRDAIRLGLDYDALVQLAGPGTLRAAGIIPSNLIGSIPADEAIETDVETAKQMIEDAGATGSKITFDYANDYTRLAGIDYNIIAQAIQTQLGAIGLTVELNPTPTSTSLQRYIDGETQLALWSWPPDYGDPDNLLVFGPGALIGERVQWTADDAPDVVALGDTARTALGDGREPAYLAWNEAIVDQAPYAYLLEPTFTLVSSSAVGAKLDPMANLNLSQIAAN